MVLVLLFSAAWRLREKILFLNFTPAVNESKRIRLLCPKAVGRLSALRRHRLYAGGAAMLLQNPLCWFSLATADFMSVGR